MASYDTEVLNDTPLAYWKCDDASGPMVDVVAGYNMTLTNSPTQGSDGPIASLAGDKSTLFTKASSQYAAAGTTKTFALGNVFTIEAWVKTASKGTTSDRRSILSNTGGTATPALEIGGQGTIGNRICITSPGFFICETDDWAAGVGEWCHIVYTRTAATAGSQTIYVNGVVMPLRTDAAQTYVDTAATWNIGRRTNGSQFFDGNIGRVAIYNTALSQTRVLAHLAAAKAANPALSWAPPVLINPTTINVSNPSPDLVLSAAQDYIIKLPTGSSLSPGTSGGLFVNGGRNIVISGGDIDISGVVSPTETSGRGMYFTNQTGTVHVEGVRIHGSTIEEGIQLNSPQAIFQIQNVRVEGLRGDSAIHSDCIQVLECKELRVDRFTGESQYQGIFIKSESGAAYNATLRKVNILGMPNSQVTFYQTARNTPVAIGTEGYYIRPPLARALNSCVNPNTGDADATVRPTVSATDGSISWPSPANITGTVKATVPQYGDFVPAATVGLGYTGQSVTSSLAYFGIRSK